MSVFFFSRQIIGACYWRSNFTDHVQRNTFKDNRFAVHGPTTKNHSHVPVYVCSFYLLSRQAVLVDYLLFKKFKVFMRIECQGDRTPYGVVKPLMWCECCLPYPVASMQRACFHTTPLPVILHYAPLHTLWYSILLVLCTNSTDLSVKCLDPTPSSQIRCSIFLSV